MYHLAFVSVLLLQLFVYLAAYFVNRAIQYKKLQEEQSPLASYKYIVLLYGLSNGSIVMLFIKMYIPIVCLVGCIITIGIYLWFFADW